MGTPTRRELDKESEIPVSERDYKYLHSLHITPPLTLPGLTTYLLVECSTVPLCARLSAAAGTRQDLPSD